MLLGAGDIKIYPLWGQACQGQGTQNPLAWTILPGMLPKPRSLKPMLENSSFRKQSLSVLHRISFLRRQTLRFGTFQILAPNRKITQAMYIALNFKSKTKQMKVILIIYLI